MNLTEVKHIYIMPMWMLLFSIAGLVSALLGDGWWDYLAWGALFWVLFTGARKLFTSYK